MAHFGVAVVPFVSTVVGTLASGLGESSDLGGRDLMHAFSWKKQKLQLSEESASDAGHDHNWNTSKIR